MYPTQSRLRAPLELPPRHFVKATSKLGTVCDFSAQNRRPDVLSAAVRCPNAYVRCPKDGGHHCCAQNASVDRPYRLRLWARPVLGKLSGVRGDWRGRSDTVPSVHPHSLPRYSKLSRSLAPSLFSHQLCTHVSTDGRAAYVSG